MPSESKHRFSFEITEEQQSRALRVFEQYGMRRAIFSPLLDEVMDLIENNGYVAISVLLDKTTKLSKVIPSLAKAERLVK